MNEIIVEMTKAMEKFLSKPNKDNEDIVVLVMQDYRAAWMRQRGNNGQA